jgi:hypothetical protein
MSRHSLLTKNLETRFTAVLCCQASKYPHRRHTEGIQVRQELHVVFLLRSSSAKCERISFHESKTRGSSSHNRNPAAYWDGPLSFREVHEVQDSTIEWDTSYQPAGPLYPMRTKTSSAISFAVLVPSIRRTKRFFEEHCATVTFIPQ